MSKSLVEDMAKLLPCPFCGGEAEIERIGDRRQSTIYICTNCGCSLETGEEFNHGQQWNARDEAAAITVLKDRLPADDRELVERLRMMAKQASEVGKMMAQSKSLRQAGHSPPRDDLYMWPTPEQTTEWQAADRITALSVSRDEIDAE